jgi:hypothetical protein
MLTRDCLRRDPRTGKRWNFLNRSQALHAQREYGIGGSK